MKLEQRYFRKFFNRNPRKEDLFVMPIMREVYDFEFNLWAKGKTNFNANSKRNRPKTMAYITRRIMQVMDTI